MTGLEPDFEAIEYEIVRQLDIDFFNNQEAALSIKDEESAHIALSMALQSRKMEKTLESTRVELTKPHVDYQRSINKIVRDLKAKISQIEENLQAKLEVWIKDQNDNPFTRVEEMQVEDGSLFLRKTWTFSIDDCEKIPREYLIVDETAVKEAVKMGVRNIPGVSIFQNEEISMRVKN